MPHMHDHLPQLTWTTAVTQWRFSPIATAVVVALALLYCWGVLRTRRREGWPAGPTAAFGTGLVALIIATQSSMGVYELQQFWIHMIRHLMLIMVAPAFLAAGRPITLFTTAVPRAEDATAAALKSPPLALITNPVFASILYAVTVVVTHLTGVMDTVMSSVTASGIEALAYVVAGYLYFLPVFGDEPIRWWLSYPMRMVIVLLSMPVDTFTGIALMQTGHPMYGMSVKAIGDGGAVMWIGGDFIMLVAILLVFRAWVRSGSTRMGWLDAARSQTLSERLGTPVSDTDSAEIDEDEEKLAAYNRWLARMNQTPEKR